MGISSLAVVSCRCRSHANNGLKRERFNERINAERGKCNVNRIGYIFGSRRRGLSEKNRTFEQRRAMYGHV